MIPECPACYGRLEFIGLESIESPENDWDPYYNARYYCHSCNTLLTRRVNEKDFPKEEAKP